MEHTEKKHWSYFVDKCRPDITDFLFTLPYDNGLLGISYVLKDPAISSD